jgi:molybdenum cofactor guanylyltransferase
MEIISIVLAGGRSSRMGTDKALLQIDGIPLLARTCLISLEIASSVYVITSRTEKYRSILPEECILIRETTPEGRERYNSPLTGFVKALNYLESIEVRADWILLLACDLPFLDARELHRWRQLLVEVKDTTMAFLPKHRSTEELTLSSPTKKTLIWEALCGFYRPSCRESLETYLDRGGRSFQGWSIESQVEELVVRDDRVLFNCNTREDWERVLSLS